MYGGNQHDKCESISRGIPIYHNKNDFCVCQPHALTTLHYTCLIRTWVTITSNSMRERKREMSHMQVFDETKFSQGIGC